jgi:hypothetical protein
VNAVCEKNIPSSLQPDEILLIFYPAVFGEEPHQKSSGNAYSLLK